MSYDVAQRYRELARDCEVLALGKNLNDAQKRCLQEMARAWRRIADEIEGPA